MGEGVKVLLTSAAMLMRPDDDARAGCQKACDELKQHMDPT